MKTILTSEQLRETLDSMAAAISTSAPAGAPVAIVGIRRRGEVLAERLLPMLEQRGLTPQHHGALDITLYRDDLTTIGPHAVVRGTEIDFDITNTWLVLVDDVLYTGRSVRAALDALTDLGRPKSIKLAVLVDRGHRELPIQPDFVGVHVETNSNQIVKVQLQEVDDAEGVALA